MNSPCIHGWKTHMKWITVPGVAEGAIVRYSVVPGAISTSSPLGTVVEEYGVLSAQAVLEVVHW